MVFSGSWVFRWGADGTDGEIAGRPADVVSIPTWIFRGFSNTGEDNGWIFTALGGDDTGGIIWHPSILRTAARHGLYLTRQNMLVDTEAGATKPPESELIMPLDDETVRSFRHYDADAMRRRVVTSEQRGWSSRALLDSALPGHGSELAPVIGFGISEDLEHAPKIANPHGFSLEWLRVATGQRIGPFKLKEKQVLIVFTGAIEVTLDQQSPLRVEAREVFSVPGDTWRGIASVGDGAAEVAMITAGDQKKHPVWADHIVRSAASHGFGVDHAGYIAPFSLLPRSAQSSAQI